MRGRILPVFKRLFTTSSMLLVGRPRSWDPPLMVTWIRLRKRFKLPSAENIEQFPDDFYTVHTDYGWAAVPQALYAPIWTKTQLKQVLDNLREPPLTVDARQKAICEWAGLIDLSMPPQVDVTDTIKQETADEKLYHQQVDFAGQLRAPDVDDGVAKPKRIMGTHAWNFYNSLRFKELKGTQPTKEIRQMIKLEWKSFDRAQKKVYLQQYSDLLDSGYILRKGEIVPIGKENS